MRLLLLRSSAAALEERSCGTLLQEHAGQEQNADSKHGQGKRQRVHAELCCVRQDNALIECHHLCRGKLRLASVLV